MNYKQKEGFLPEVKADSYSLVFFPNLPNGVITKPKATRTMITSISQLPTKKNTGGFVKGGGSRNKE